MKSKLALSVISVLFLVGLIGSTIKSDRASIRANAKTLHAQIEACTATTPANLPPDGFQLSTYLSDNKIELRKVEDHMPQIFAAIDVEGNLAPVDSTVMEYGDFVLINPSHTSYELRYVGKDKLTYPAFSQ